MSAALIIPFVLLLFYAATLLTSGVAFRRMPVFATPDNIPAIPVTIVICARNEQPHLSACLRNLIAQQYPKELMQVIVVNDASTDSTSLIADTELEHSGIEHRILSNPSRQGKKRSISAAIRFARHELIVLRDADTYSATGQWLSSIAALYARKPGLIIAPVAICAESSTMAAMQNVESKVLAAVTGGSAYLNRPFLCSGANLAFPREVFKRTRGFESHSHLISGDDVFFLEDVKKLKDVPVSYLKSPAAVVFTFPLTAAKDLLLQKARWASKFKYNPNPLNLWLAFLAFAVNFFTVIAWAGVIFRPAYRLECLLFISMKISTDLLVLSLASALRIPGPGAGRMALAALFYPFYACAVAVVSVFTTPVWKEE